MEQSNSKPYPTVIDNHSEECVDCKPPVVEIDNNFISQTSEVIIEGDLAVVKTIEELRNLEDKYVQALESGVLKGVQVLGYYEEGDTPSPIIYHKSDTTESDDGGSVINVSRIKVEHKFTELDFSNFGASSSNLDNSPFIQKALSYIARTSTCKLELIPNKVYPVESKITIDFPIDIDGNNCQIKCSTYVGDVLEFTSDYNKVQNLHVSHSGYYSQSGSIVFRNSNYNRITNCLFNGKSNAGILFEKSIGNIVTGNRFEDKSYGICLRESYSNTITSNYFTGGYRKGVVTEDGGGYITVPLGDGIKMTSGLTTQNNPNGGLKTVITSNIFDGVWRDGIDMFSDGEEIIFSNNHLIGCEALGMDIKTIYRDNPDVEGGTSIEGLRQSSNIIITDNYFKDTGLTTDAAAISIQHRELRDGQSPSIPKGVHNVVISNNQFHNGYKTGVRVEYSKNVVINGNIFKNVPYESIHMSGVCEDININGNVFESDLNTSYPIFGTASPENKRIIITNNSLKGNGLSLYGINVNGSDLLISNNIISGFANNMYLDRVNGALITSNFIKNASSQGIRVSSTNFTVSDISIFNNKFDGCARCIFYNANSSNMVSSGNVFKNYSIGAEVNVNLVNNYQTSGNFLII